jgi:hypothetical protein
LKLTDKYFKKISNNILDTLGNKKLKLKVAWDKVVPKPVKYWGTPVDIVNGYLIVEVSDKNKKQSFFGENGDIVLNMLNKQGFKVEKIKVNVVENE